ncbi:MAG: diguanylate cyclase [Chloroflexi bacterium]|nr:diguanylate cyclase [Chloroflexota bacterium]
MELKIYLRMLLKKWWIVLPAFLVTFTSTIVFTFTQAPTYRAVATFVVTPTSFEDIRSFASGLDMLSRRTEIATTYTEVAVSRLIRGQAGEELDLSQSQRKGLSVESKLRAGTNVFEIAVEGSDPVLVKDFANTIGIKTMTYVQELYEMYSLSPLDEATTPSLPIKPNKKLNIALGGVFGLALGVGLAFLSVYLQTPMESVTGLGVFDDETGVYNSRYFRQRLGEEMSRAKRNEYPLSLAFLNVDQLGVIDGSFSPQARNEALRKVVVFLKQYLRKEDIIARFSETVFAFLLPDVPEEEAQTMVEKLQTRVAWTPFELERSGIKLNLTSAAGVAAYNYNGTMQDEFLAQANRALQQAEAAGYGKVHSFSENGEKH